MAPGSFEELFDQSLHAGIEQIQRFTDIDLVIAFPFYNETVVFVEALQIVEQGLQHLIGNRQAILLCVGDPAGIETLALIQALKPGLPLVSFLMKAGANGRGASIRAILEISRRLEANVLIMAADLRREGYRGLQPNWAHHMLQPIFGDYDMSLAIFERHYSEDVISSLFAAPLLECFYNARLQDPFSGIYGLSHDLVEDYCLEMKFWTETTRSYGIDPWMVTRALTWNKKICQVKLGSKLNPLSLEKLNFLFKEYAGALFNCIKKDESFWSKMHTITSTPDTFGDNGRDIPCAATFTVEHLVQTFQSGGHHYFQLYQQVLPDTAGDILIDVISKVDMDSPTSVNAILRFDGPIWAQTVYQFLLHYRFSTDLQLDDLLTALTFAFDGRLASFMAQQQQIISAERTGTHSWPLAALADALKKEQGHLIIDLRDAMKELWLAKAREFKPPLTPANYLEFIPGIPVILPKRLEGRGGEAVWTEGIFNALQARYQSDFNHFMSQGLELPEHAPAASITGALMAFLLAVEEALEKWVPGDLYTEEGVLNVARAIFSMSELPRGYSVSSEMLAEMLLRFPPINVMIPSGYRNARLMIENSDVRDMTTLANLVENRKYSDRALLWILDHLTPECMEEVEIRPIILGSKVLDGTVVQGNISNLNKITMRITISPLSKGMGGEFPRIRFCLYILRHIMIAQDYSNLWRIYSRERKNLGDKIRNSLIGKYQTDVFSAHNIFENMHHRAMVELLKHIAQSLFNQGHGKDARLLEVIAEGYGLSQVLDDDTFLPCSAWTWSSYSYKGGKGIPTALSSHVEEKWFNHHLLEAIQTAMGYDLDQISQLVVQFIGEGRASDNLLDVLVGVKAGDVSVVAQEVTLYPPAGPLKRYADNPILVPIPDHKWENRYVLNAGALRIKDRVYLFYRAFGDEEISRIGLAVTDGFRILERLPEPIFAPAIKEEQKGCEDPRVVLIKGEIYMLYTAYDGITAQVAAASISLEDFLARRFQNWHRIGMAFEGVWDKDAILFPEKIKGKYVIYHRIEPSVWVSYLNQLVFPAPKDTHAIILGPRSGRMWDSLKIGAGTQPIKTEYGWLMIYHGVDRNRVYRLGVLLVDYENPERLLYRSPNPVLSPEAQYEKGLEGQCWVPNVVFTCGAVASADLDVLGAEDEILVYYGAADTYVCVASAKVGDLIPQTIRHSIENRNGSGGAPRGGLPPA